MYSLNYIKKKFYEQGRYSKKFSQINEETIEEIDKMIERFKQIYLKDLNINSNIYRLEVYIAALRYLGAHYEIPFDTRMIFLIRLCDPECLSLKFYKDAGIIKNETLDSIEKKSERESARKENDRRKKQLSIKLHDILGFYDPQIIFYEQQYFKKFKNELLMSCKLDTGDLLFTQDFNFENVTDEDVDYVKERISWYKDNYNIPDVKTVLYQIIFQNKILKLRSREQQVLFLILLTDPEFDVLKIYYEESKWDMIEKRILEVYGYYNQEIVFLEGNCQNLIAPPTLVDPFK